jgi:hypothetical protein
MVQPPFSARWTQPLRYLTTHLLSPKPVPQLQLLASPRSAIPSGTGHHLRFRLPTSRQVADEAGRWTDQPFYIVNHAFVAILHLAGDLVCSSPQGGKVLFPCLPALVL